MRRGRRRSEGPNCEAHPVPPEEPLHAIGSIIGCATARPAQCLYISAIGARRRRRHHFLLILARSLRCRFPRRKFSIVAGTKASTQTPAAAISREGEFGALTPGFGADITVLDVLDVELELEDVHRQMRVRLLDSVGVARS